jgi:Regulator of chromosome condensation (RCC1) repeat
MNKSWRAVVFVGVAVELSAGVLIPGCGSSPEKKRVPSTFNPGDAGASGDTSAAAGNTSGGSIAAAGKAGSAPVAGDAGTPADEGGAAGAAGASGAPNNGGSGGALLTGCALGDACCASNQCESSLECLGAACSCVADLSNYYMRRTDGVAFLTLANDTAQTVVSNADTGMPLHGIKDIMGSPYHGCAALDSGQVRCWSLVADPTVGNNSGQLGNGVLNGPFTPLAGTLVKTDATTYLSDVITVGSDAMTYSAAPATCAATSTGFAYCWGYNAGYFIQPTGGAVPFATKITTALNGPALTGVTQVSVGNAHACVLTNGKVRCWGQTGTAPAEAYPAVDIVLPGTVLKIVAGYSVSCALTTTDAEGGAVYCWGDNNGGKLGIGDPAAVGYTSNSPARVRIDANTFLNNVTDLAASYGGACVVRTDHTLLCWGNAQYYATPMAVGGIKKTAANVAITDAAKVSAPSDGTVPRYVTTGGVEYSGGLKITPNCTIQE